MAVAFVGQKINAEFGSQVIDLLELLAIEHRATRIRRGVDEDHLGAGRQMRLNHRSRQGEAVLLVGFDEYALAPGVIYYILICDPIRHGNDDFVARVDQRLRQIEDDVFAAHADDALRRFVVRPEIFRVTRAYRLLQLGSSTGAGVFGEVLFDRPDSGLLDV